ncbi:MAG TPA: efflux RND transporter periplasmic adaptor subunit [Gemmatimonadaceae bacterium]
MNRNILYVALIAAAGCTSSATKTVPIQTATIQRRDIIVTAEATGVIEPINVVEVKSKTASGQVMAMPIDIGYFVKPGDLIVQIDTTILHQQFVQATADYTSARSNLMVAQAQLKRQQELYAQHIITLDVLETAQNAAASSTASEVRNHANVDLAGQALVDARVTATTTGTILTKPVSIGQVIQAGGTSVSGGTVIATMADLTKVRARALVAETDIGMVKPGQTVNVTIDAFPDHPFAGTVDHVEPQATVQQNVTMFATLIALDNSEGLLHPGMNGEVSIVADTRLDAIAVPNDAIRSPREAAQAAALLGLNVDTVRAQMKAGGGGGGGGGGQGGRGGPGGGRQVQISNGELALPLQGGGQGGGQGSGMRGGQRGPQVQVTDADCKKVDDAMKKKPAVAKKIDDMRTKLRDPNVDRQKMQEDMKAAYAQLGVDMMVSGACRRRAGGDNAGGAAGGAGGARGGRGGRGGMGGGAGAAGAGGGAGGGFGQQGNSRTRPRTGLVFVQKGTTWEAKTVRLGVANYDYTEVIGDGLKEGDKVAMLSAAALQATRQAQNDRMKAGASPLGGSAPGGGGRGPGRGN